MLRVTIDLIPFGQEEHTENLRTIEIANVGPYSKNDDIYGLYLYDWTCSDLNGQVKHYRKDPVEVLVRLVMEDELRKRFLRRAS